MINNRPSEHEITHTLTIDIDNLSAHLPAGERLRDSEIEAIMGQALCNSNEIDIDVVSTVEYTPEDPRTFDDTGWPEIFECLTSSERIAWEEANKIVARIKDFKVRMKVFPLIADAICEAHVRWAEKDMDEDVSKALTERAIDYEDYKADALHEERRERGHE